MVKLPSVSTHTLFALLTVGAASNGFADPFIRAETPWSERRAAEIGVIAPSTASEWIDRPAGQLLPWDSRRNFDPFGANPFLFGAERELFRSGPVDSTSGINFGNEVGDPLWQELKQQTTNRTPTTQAFGFLPLSSGFSVWGELRQVDHWSGRFAPGRKARTVPSGEWGDSFDELHSWFGENYPDFSAAGGGLLYGDSLRTVSLQGRSTWWWVPSPVSQRELPLRVDELQGAFDYAGWGVRSRHFFSEVYDLSESDGSGFNIHELLLYGGQPRGETLWRPWVMFRWEERRGNFPLIPEAGFRPLIGLDRTKEFPRGFRFSGSHWVGGSEWGIRDTVEHRLDRGSHRFLHRVFGQLSNRLHPFDGVIELDQNGAAVGDLTCASTWQHYGAQSDWSGGIGLWKWSVSATPWVGRDLPLFVADSYRYNSREKRTFRRGDLKILEGNLWGSQQRIALSRSGCPCQSWELEYLNDRPLAGPWNRAELTPPEHRAALRYLRRLVTGLDLRAALLYTSGSTVRYRTAEPFIEPDRFELNLEFRQHLFDDRGEVWLSLLNPLALDEPLAPDGADDRFRALAGALWKF